MLFSSLPFLCIFLPLTLLGYHLLSRHIGAVSAAVWLIAASLVFYGYWKIEDLSLLLGSVLINYLCGWLLQRRIVGNGLILTAGIAGNLLLLGYFKYASFFCTVLLGDVAACKAVSRDLPLAISFFTFTQIAFLVDAWRGQVRDRDPLRYALFVVFFPHLIAGPIVHYHDIGPQLADRARFRITADNLTLGSAIFIVGLFKKVMLADRFGAIASPIFAAADGVAGLSPVTAWTGAVAYTLQLYFDFSGYSDMAVGLAMMFGIRFPANFHSPYKATSLIDFWRRWHITLSLFLRDYLYIPLGGNRNGAWRRYANLLITMLLGGLWHGANWTFLAWGGLHGIGLAVNHIWRSIAPAAWRNRQGQPLVMGVAWLVTMVFVVGCWVCFRAGSLDTAMKFYTAMAGFNSVDTVASGISLRQYFLLLAGIALCVIAPNSNQLFDIPVRGLKLVPSAAILRFDRRLIDLLVLAILLGLSLTNLLKNAPSEFLYFDF